VRLPGKNHLKKRLKYQEEQGVKLKSREKGAQPLPFAEVPEKKRGNSLTETRFPERARKSVLGEPSKKTGKKKESPQEKSVFFSERHKRAEKKRRSEGGQNPRA